VQPINGHFKVIETQSLDSREAFEFCSCLDLFLLITIQQYIERELHCIVHINQVCLFGLEGKIYFWPAEGRSILNLRM
jgi:hypothetical protein